MGSFLETYIDPSCLGSVFLLFPMRVARAHAYISLGKSPAPGSS